MNEQDKSTRNPMPCDKVPAYRVDCNETTQTQFHFMTLNYYFLFIMCPVCVESGISAS